MQSNSVARRLPFSGGGFGMPFIVGGGFDSFRSPLGLPSHRHSGHEITYVFSGRVHWETGCGTVLTLRGGDMAVIQPGVVHHGRFDIIEPAAIFWLVIENTAFDRETRSGFGEDELRTILAILTAAGNIVRPTDGSLDDDLWRLHAALESLAAQAPELRPLAAAECRARIVSIIVSATKLVAGAGEPRRWDSCIAGVLEFISGSLRDPSLSVADIARHAGLSESRLHAVFRQTIGITPNDYLQRRRIDTACAMLASTSTPITRVALEVGFSSSQYFATCFRKYTGMSPGKYRRVIAHRDGRISK